MLLDPNAALLLVAPVDGGVLAARTAERLVLRELGVGLPDFLGLLVELGDRALVLGFAALADLGADQLAHGLVARLEQLHHLVGVGLLELREHLLDDRALLDGRAGQVREFVLRLRDEFGGLPLLLLDASFFLGLRGELVGLRDLLVLLGDLRRLVVEGLLDVLGDRVRCLRDRLVLGLGLFLLEWVHASLLYGCEFLPRLGEAGESFFDLLHCDGLAC